MQSDPVVEDLDVVGDGLVGHEGVAAGLMLVKAADQAGTDPGAVKLGDDRLVAPRQRRGVGGELGGGHGAPLEDLHILELLGRKVDGEVVTIFLAGTTGAHMSITGIEGCGAMRAAV